MILTFQSKAKNFINKLYKRINLPQRIFVLFSRTQKFLGLNANNSEVNELSVYIKESLIEQQMIRKSLTEMMDLLLDYQTTKLQNNHLNPLNAYGCKGFSQTDEDGITIEIIKRLQLKNGTYAEFGVGNGMENNTLILASMGWRGFWVGGEELAFKTNSNNKFSYFKSWITLDNILELTQKGIEQLQMNEIDLLSLDLDGNDIYFVERLLVNKIHPKIFIVEYNAQFPPPARFQISYDSNHIWQGDNYFGAALQNFNDLFKAHDYTLICCNSHTGTNAFFIQNKYIHLFPDVPKDISKIFVPPRYFLYQRFGHLQSPKVTESILEC